MVERPWALARETTVMVIAIDQSLSYTLHSIPVLVEAMYSVECHLVESYGTILTANHLNKYNMCIKTQ